MKQLTILLSLAFLVTSCDSILSPQSSTTDKSQQPSPQIMQSHQQSVQGNWERQQGADPGYVNLSSTYFVNSQTGWIVGGNYKQEASVIWKTNDGGENWFEQNGPGTALNSVYFVDAKTGWAAGINSIIHTNDGGQIWQVQRQQNDIDIEDIHFIDSQTGWAVSTKGLVWHTENGRSWELLPSRLDALYSVYFVNSQTGWAVGSENSGVIYHTSDGGKTWDKQSRGMADNLRSIHFVDEDNGWAGGWDGNAMENTGVILHTNDGGLNWTKWESDEDMQLRSVYFVDKMTGWAAGEITTTVPILHTTDGGQTWKQQKRGKSNSLSSVHFVDSQNGWAVGSEGILHYSAEQEEPPPPEPTGQTIYEEALNDPWIDASWNASVNYASSERARSGSQSIHVEQNAWGALSTRSGRWGDSQNISPGQFKQVEFAVYAPEQPVRLDLRLQNSGGDDFPRVRHGTVEAGSWNVVSVSLAELNPNDHSWNRLVVSESSGSAKTYFVDELGLTGDGEAPPPEDEPEALTVYQDKLKDQWIDASWSAAVDYTNSERSHAGSRSIRVDQNAWGALSTRSGQWGNPKNIDPDQYKRVKFAVYASEQPATIDLILENDQGNDFPRVRYGRVEAGSWTTVSVPLAKLNPDGHPFNRIDIAESSGAARTYFVDELKLAGSSGSGQMAANTK